MDTDRLEQQRKTDGRRDFFDRLLNGVSASRHMLGRFKVLPILLTVVGLGAASIGNALTQDTSTLSTAASFGALGGWTVRDTSDTTVNAGSVNAGSVNAGSVNAGSGFAPGLAATGFPPGVVVPAGEIRVANAVAQQAQSDLTVADNGLAGQACDINLTGSDLGGLVLTSGVYCLDTSAQLTGELTLDLEGDPEAVFVFLMGSTLTTAPDASVVFVNGAPGCDRALAGRQCDP